MEKHGLLSLEKDGISILPRGRLLIRNICMVFDKYLRSGTAKGTYSKVI
jgi:oxygen-independent coproporphyrinogen-3 oxidase